MIWNALSTSMNIQLRIAIDGAQSSGKTTLWTQLEQLYATDFVFIPEAARQVAPSFGVEAAGDWSRLLGDKNRLEAFFCAEEKWQGEQECRERFISDSSLYLIQAYRRVFGLQQNERVLQQTRYDLVFYCGINLPVSDDGFRFVKCRDEVDLVYRELLASRFLGLVVELKAEQRLRHAVAAIDAIILERVRASHAG
jgi:nicotinamide riboside kinase